MKKKYYKVITSVVTGQKSYLVENSIIVFQQVPTKKSYKTEIYCQGQDSLLNIDKFNDLLNSNLIEEIQLTQELSDTINEYVIEPEKYSTLKKWLSEFTNKYPQYQKQFTTFSTWVFQAKGSPAATISEEILFQKDKNKVLNETVLRTGMKAKPGSPHKNRGTRQSRVSDIQKWETDDSTLLPNGIRKSDQCGFSQAIKIFEERLIDILSIIDTPQDIKDFWATKGYAPREFYLVDYYYKTPISWKYFDSNTHHSKVKGLEFCHINPELDYTTTSKNTVIGTSESNRHQGGYSHDFTWRKQLIMRIYDMKATKENHLTLQSELDSYSTDELEKMYFTSKF